MEETKKPKTIQIFMNDQSFDLPKAEYTGKDLKADTGIPAADLLYRLKARSAKRSATSNLSKSTRMSISLRCLGMAAPGIRDAARNLQLGSLISRILLSAAD